MAASGIRSDPNHRRSFTGVVEPDYIFEADVAGSNLRGHRVQWEREVSRDRLSAATLDTPGSAPTVLKINPVEDAVDAGREPLPRGAEMWLEYEGTSSTEQPATSLEARLVFSRKSGDSSA